MKWVCGFFIIFYSNFLCVIVILHHGLPFALSVVGVTAFVFWGHKFNAHSDCTIKHTNVRLCEWELGNRGRLVCVNGGGFS